MKAQKNTNKNKKFQDDSLFAYYNLNSLNK